MYKKKTDRAISVYLFIIRDRYSIVNADGERLRKEERIPKKQIPFSLKTSFHIKTALQNRKAAFFGFFRNDPLGGVFRKDPGNVFRRDPTVHLVVYAENGGETAATDTARFEKRELPVRRAFVVVDL